MLCSDSLTIISDEADIIGGHTDWWQENEETGVNINAALHEILTARLDTEISARSQIGWRCFIYG